MRAERTRASSAWGDQSSSRAYHDLDREITQPDGLLCHTRLFCPLIYAFVVIDGRELAN